MKTYLKILFIIFPLKIWAQDPFFTQAFNAPLTLNPATAGTVEMDLRFTATFKRQWVNVPSAMGATE